MTHFDFIKSLGYEIMDPHLQKILATQSLQPDLNQSIKKILRDNLPPVQEDKVKEEEAGSSDQNGNEENLCNMAICKKKENHIHVQETHLLECSRKVCDCGKEVVYWEFDLYIVFVF